VADLRPTEITLAVADVNGRFLSHEAIPTPQNPRAAVAELSARMCHLVVVHSELVFEGIGISVPGRFDPMNQHRMRRPRWRWRPRISRGGFHVEANRGYGIVN
jgi:predicted NBD/HSP70 family sugar kinase